MSPITIRDIKVPRPTRRGAKPHGGPKPPPGGGDCSITLQPSGSDQTTELLAAGDALADGGKLCLQNGTYILSPASTWTINNKNGITVEGNDSTIYHPAISNSTIFQLNSCTGSTVQNLRVQGQSTGVFNHNYEFERGFIFQDCTDCTLDYWQGHNIGGDFVQLRGHASSGLPNVRSKILHGTGDVSGAGITINRDAFNAEIAYNDINHMGRNVLDIEMTNTDAVCQDLNFHHNTCGIANLPFLYAGGGGGVHRNITIADNTCATGLGVSCGVANGVRDRFNIQILRNTSTHVSTNTAGLGSLGKLKPIASATSSAAGYTITYTENDPLHPFGAVFPGLPVTVAGVTPSGWNGVWPVIASTGPTSFTVQLDNSPANGTAFGTVGSGPDHGKVMKFFECDGVIVAGNTLSPDKDKTGNPIVNFIGGGTLGVMSDNICAYNNTAVGILNLWDTAIPAGVRWTDGGGNVLS